MCTQSVKHLQVGNLGYNSDDLLIYLVKLPKSDSIFLNLFLSVN